MFEIISYIKVGYKGIQRLPFNVDIFTCSKLYTKLIFSINHLSFCSVFMFH